MDPLLSSGFPVDVMEKKMAQRRQSLTRLRPYEFFQILQRHRKDLASYEDLIAWAQQQANRGVDSFQRFMAQQGTRMPGLFGAWTKLQEIRSCYEAEKRSRRLKLWRTAAAQPCICSSPNRLREALLAALEYHQKDVGRWAFELCKLVSLGTSGKANGMLLWGASNSGKTGLTRPIIHVFGEAAWLRPNAGETFPLQDVSSKLIGVWQDWRLQTCPISWDTILLLLEGESLSCPVKGQPSTVVHSPPGLVVTTQVKVVASSPDEQEAFNNRWALRWGLKHALPAELKDPELKLCYRCTGCYVRLMEEKSEAYKLEHEWAAAQLLRTEQALEKQHRREMEAVNRQQPASREIEAKRARVASSSSPQQLQQQPSEAALSSPQRSRRRREGRRGHQMERRLLCRRRRRESRLWCRMLQRAICL